MKDAYKQKIIEDHMKSMENDEYYFAQVTVTGDRGKTINLDRGALELLRAYYAGEKQRIRVETPGGVLLAEEKGAYDEYPGIWILKEDQNGYVAIMAAVEYNTPDGNLLIESYSQESEEPLALIDFKAGHDLLR